MKGIMKLLKLVRVGIWVGVMTVGTSSAVPPVPPLPIIDSIQLEPDGGLFAAVSEKGLYRRVAGQDWKLVLAARPLTRATISHPKDEWMLAGYFYGGPIYKSRDRGRTWFAAGVSKRLAEFDGLTVEDKGRLSVTTGAGLAYLLYRDKLIVSEDGGASWSLHRITNLPEPIDPYMQSITASDAEVYVLSGNTLHRSFDHGKSWQLVEQSSETSPVSVGIDGQRPTLGFAPDGTLLALGPVVTSQRIFASKDGGNSWNEVRFGLERDSAIALEIYGADSEGMYFFVRSRTSPGPVFRALYRMGKDGKLIQMGVDPNIIAGVTRNYLGQMYALTDGGSKVLESQDGGKTWSPISRDSIVR